MTAAAIMGVVYGLDIEAENGASYFKVAEEAVEILSAIAHSGSYLGMEEPPSLQIAITDALLIVDSLPLCKNE